MELMGFNPAGSALPHCHGGMGGDCSEPSPQFVKTMGALLEV